MSTPVDKPQATEMPAIPKPCAQAWGSPDKAGGTVSVVHTPGLAAVIMHGVYAPAPER